MMTNVFDEVGARQVLDHLGNVVGRHVPLGVFLRDADLFALADCRARSARRAGFDRRGDAVRASRRGGDAQLARADPRPRSASEAS